MKQKIAQRHEHKKENRLRMTIAQRKEVKRNIIQRQQRKKQTNLRHYKNLRMK